MFKKISLVTVALAGILLAGCSSQSASSTDTNTKSEQTTQKGTKSSTPKKKSATKKDNQTNNDNIDDSQGTDSNSQKDSTDNGTNSQTGTSTDKTTTTAPNDNQSSDQNTQDSSNGVNLTTSDQAVEYLAKALSTTYDNTNTQYVANGKITWNNVTGYQVNIYSKGSDSPAGSYIVQANGQYSQLW
ncbi:hypothetical protein [Companilactobacillus insicii]|uniref:hypothetical protein n=1 Tax=Companilactobacillus insicii TaxID=1732567 RepID=UPI000F7A0DAE|nr:hypothetical protein [Companilactobacillus insicii]